MSSFDIDPLPCGGTIATHVDGRWDWAMPSGKHVRGKAETQAAALAAATAEYHRWIVEQWAKGKPLPRGHWAVPLN